MKKSTSYSTLLLGCVSSCLVSVAFAQSHDTVIFTEVPDITNIAGGAHERFYHYTVKNTDSYEVKITELGIKIYKDDDFPHDHDLVKIVENYDDQSQHKECYKGKELHAGQSCKITVKVYPKALDHHNHTLIEDGEIERALFLSLTNAQRHAQSPIDFDITILGSAENYALLANALVIEQSHVNDVQAESGNVQVSQDVGYGSTIQNPHGIVFHDGAKLIPGFDDNRYAFADIDAAHRTLRDAVHDHQGKCTGNKLKLTGGPHIINPGFYCVTGGYFNPNYLVLNKPMVLNGDEDSLFVFVMPEGKSAVLDIDRGTSYILNGALAENVYWVGADEIEVDTGVQFLGNIITRGEVHAMADFVWPPNLTPAAFKGRILGMADQQYSFAKVILNGNAIEKP